MAAWKIEILATAPADASLSGRRRALGELGGALAHRGHRVRVLYPADPPAPASLPEGVVAVPVPVGERDRRARGGELAIGRNASDLLDPMADVVVGVDETAGALWWKERPGGRPALVMVVHDLARERLEARRPPAAGRRLRARVGTWLDRRALGRLEASAFERARLVLVDSERCRRLLASEYGVAQAHLHPLVPGVPDPLDVGSKADARKALRVPMDVPAVAFLGGRDEAPGLPVALDAFRRVRPLFPGARLLVAGSAVPAEPGVMPLGAADPTVEARALRASDLFLFPTGEEGFDPAPILAMRYGVATIVSRHVPLDGAKDGREARIVPAEDGGEYASALAELLADPPMRRSIGEAGRRYADRFTFANMAETFEGLVAPLLR
jgi:glycosyltransferase involved in cell wall biosynthesis